MGLAIHNGHILSLSLARALYKKLLGSPLELDDLQEMHSGVYNSLKHLLAYDAELVEEDMGLTFQARSPVVLPFRATDGTSSPCWPAAMT